MVDGVLCLVNPVNDRVTSLLNSVKHDSSWSTSRRDVVCLKYAFSASWQVNSLLQLQFFLINQVLLLQFSTFFLNYLAYAAKVFSEVILH